MAQRTAAAIQELKSGDAQLIEVVGADARQQAALLQVGHRLFQQGRLNDARKIFCGLTVMDGNNPYVYGMLGAIFQKEKRPPLALACYNKSLDLFPGDINSLTNRGEILLKLGRFEEAAADLKQAITLDTERKHPAANRARLLVILVQDALSLLQDKGLAAVEQERQRNRVAAGK